MSEYINNFVKEILRKQKDGFAIKYEYGTRCKIEIVNEDIATAFIPEESMNEVLDGVHSWEFNTHNISEAGYDVGLEMLYNHLPYGYNNNSSVILINEDKQVLAVKINEDAPAFQIVVVSANFPGFFVYNNKKKIHREIKLAEFIALINGKKASGSL